jgi:uncharacterized membrane protein YkvA (DUF1232 family)/endonuclease YncB( thermonuclease family)
MMKRLARIFQPSHAARLGVYLIALWKLFKHPQTPRGVRWLAVAVLAYAVSPIDLIPDFIPVLGWLDDLVLIPLGLALVVRLVPKPLWEQVLREAETDGRPLPRLVWGAVGVVAVWVLVIGLLTWAIVAHAAPPPAPQGKVSQVPDAGSVVVQWADGKTTSVKLAGIDAPDGCQPGGKEALAALREWLLNQPVTLKGAGKDAKGQPLATVLLDGDDINRRLVAEGHAFSLRTKWDRGPYVAQERAAAALSRGLHAQGRAEVPSDYRRTHAPCAAP